MPPQTTAPPDFSGYVKPQPQGFNNPFADEEFGKSFDAAFAKDEEQRTTEKKKEDVKAIVENKPDPEKKEPDKQPDEVEKPKEASTVPEVKDVKEPEKKVTKEGKAFAEMRTKIKALEEELSRRPATPQVVPDADLKKKYDELVKERDAISERLMQADIERHPEFQKAFTSKVNEAIATTKEIVGPEVADKIEAILKMPFGKYRQEQIDELAEKLTPYQLNALTMADITLKQLNKQKDETLAKPQELWKQMQAKEREFNERQQAESKQVFDAMLAQAASKENGVFTFQEKEDDADWNKTVAERKRMAEAIYTGNLKLEDRARAAAWAASAPALVARLKAMTEELETLKKENESLKESTPSPAGGGAEEKITPTEFKGDYVDGVAVRAAEFFQR